MSKTLTGILETAIGVGLEFTPLAPLGTSLIVAGVGTVLTALLTHTPRPDTTDTAVKQPIPPRVSAYGKTALLFTVEYAE